MSWTWAGRGLITVATVGVLAAAPAASAQDDVSGAGNRAVIDPAATAAVLSRANELCEQLLSYDYRTLDEHERRLAELTTGDFTEEYRELYGDFLEQEAVSQQFVLRSTVAESAVRRLAGDDAEVLVYLDQSSTTGAGGSGNAGTMFLFSLRRVDGKWLAADLEMLGAQS